MKKIFLITVLLFTTTAIFAQADVDQNGLKSSVINTLAAANTQAKRYEIATIGYNSHHWQSGGIIVVELFQLYYATGYEKYIIENGYGQGTDSSLAVIKLVESSGKTHNAQLSLGNISDLTTSVSGYINKSLPIILDVRNYGKYKVKITYSQDKVDVLTAPNQIKINQTPTGTDISDFAVSTELDNNLITSGNLRISGAGNHYIQNGNVGIGTASPDTKLTVNGTIHTKEVKVDLLAPMVPDYVFATDYKLRSLSEVENYIKENSHLPEIPSAREIEKNGLMLAEMNMNLLKKVEELTLYLIEQKKRIDKIEVENQNLKNEVKSIRKNKK